ncbi:MAG: hypothetical protein PHU06_12635 [Gallionella sp.]|nr:hypothetical protein [Gallionella sp.]MDD4959473.1 hypothetical protein [Gallionella sp.]
MFKRLFVMPFIWLAAAIFLAEELLWDVTAWLMSYFRVFRVVVWVENWMSSLSPKVALFAFCLPSLILIPAKLFALSALAHGHVWYGASILMAAKVTGMALFSRIFRITKPALMTLPQFVRLHDWVMGYRNRIHAYIENLSAFQVAKAAIRLAARRNKSTFLHVARYVRKSLPSKIALSVICLSFAGFLFVK